MTKAKSVRPTIKDVAKAGIVTIMATAMTGCVTVNAPSEPIVIELNINITQEVIYRLAEDAGNTIDENADIF
ncbi:MAG: YnbE family lipoprotein [Pontixanthobacter sp.]